MRNIATRATSNVAMNFPILFAALGIALAVAANKIAETANLPLILQLFIGVCVGITVIGALIFMVWQVLAVLTAHEKAPAFFRSAFVGAFILLVTIISIDHSSFSIVFALIGFIICIGAFILSLWNVEEAALSGSGSGGGPRDLRLTYKPFLPEQEAPAIASANIAKLVPLFENDPLYISPQTDKNRSFSFFTVGRGPSTLENDDAFYAASNKGFFALCDGASQSKYSRPWGALLGQQWCEQPLLNPRDVDNWLRKPRKNWESWVKGTLKQKLNIFAKDTGNSVEDTDHILEMGAATTFLGLSLLGGRKAEWHATALGNTCLFIFSNNQYQYREYFQSPRAYSLDGKPVLINSADRNMEQLATKFEVAEGRLNAGDIFIMATQPLAQWILPPPSNGKGGNADQKQREWSKRVSDLLLLNSQADFENYVRQLPRKSGVLAEDYSMAVIRCS